MAEISAADELVRAVNSARTAIANGELLKGLATLLSLIGSTPSLAELLEGDVVGCLRDLSEALLPHHAGASTAADGGAGDGDASAPAANAPADVAKLRYLFANTRRALPRSADLRHNEGAMLHRAGEHRNAIACFEAALALEPGHAAAAESLESLRSFAAERWHFRMLNDRERNSEYDRAIGRAVTRLRARNAAAGQPVTVLDIGAGTGILSMMAARAGADRVYGCEMNPLLCEVARETVSSAGYNERVAMLQCHSTMLSVVGEGPAGGGGGGSEASPTTLPSRADLIVTELVDSGLVGGRC